MKKLLDWLNEPDIDSAEREFRYFFVVALIAMAIELVYCGVPH